MRSGARLLLSTGAIYLLRLCQTSSHGHPCLLSTKTLFISNQSLQPVERAQSRTQACKLEASGQMGHVVAHQQPPDGWQNRIFADGIKRIRLRPDKSLHWLRPNVAYHRTMSHITFFPSPITCPLLSFPRRNCTLPWCSIGGSHPIFYTI